ncbi:heat shock protein [Artemisia annua]|uniref:Heat shock protein n=1 Tax=Artemisia annua TaxID=35608 RepID=A0A2U1MKZ7_ARTAN|nr:heat shock protein [Artemisia annua]
MTSHENGWEHQGKSTNSNCEDTIFHSIDTYGYDIVEYARNLGPLVGRDDEITSLITILAKLTKNNPLLVGEDGVGKTAIVKGLAKRIENGDVPSSLNGVRLIALATRAFLPGDEYKEELKFILKKLDEAADGRLILFIDDIHLILGACGSMDVANLLKLLLDRGQLRCIGATTPEQFRKYVKEDATFNGCFQQVFVAEPSVDDTINILRALKESYEAHHAIQILDSALVAAAEISSLYVTGFQPDKAMTVVDQACTEVRLQLLRKPKEIYDLERKKTHLMIEFCALEMEKDKKSKLRFVEVQKELCDVRDKLEPLMIKYKKEKEKQEEALVVLQEADVARTANVKLGVVQGVGPAMHENMMLMQTLGPVTRPTLRSCDQKGLIVLAKRLQERVVGQDEAVNVVADAMLRSRAVLGKANKPAGLLFFVGPSGVGKTEIARAFSEQLFADEKFMIKINMCLYTEEESVPCYVGQLTETVKKEPYSVVVFDKVEKAHPSVFHALHHMLDDGCSVDFTHTVLIMTSNIGENHLLRALSENTSMEDARLEVMEEVRRHFKPDLLKRFDAIVVFNPLSYDLLRKVARLVLKDIAIRLAKKGVTLQVMEAALHVIVPESYDLVYGAEPIKIWLENNLVTRLSNMLITNEIDKNSTVYVDADSNGKDLSYRVVMEGGKNAAKKLKIR